LIQDFANATGDALIFKKNRERELVQEMERHWNALKNASFELVKYENESRSTEEKQLLQTIGFPQTHSKNASFEFVKYENASRSTEVKQLLQSIEFLQTHSKSISVMVNTFKELEDLWRNFADPFHKFVVGIKSASNNSKQLLLITPKRRFIDEIKADIARLSGDMNCMGESAEMYSKFAGKYVTDTLIRFDHYTVLTSSERHEEKQKLEESISMALDDISVHLPHLQPNPSTTS